MSKKKPLPVAPRTYPARYAILVMLALAMVSVVGSRWFYSQVQKRPLELWGTSAATAIANAPRAEALRLGPPGEASTTDTIETIRLGEQRYAVLDRKDVSNVPGFSHLRASLVNDASFDWEGQPGDSSPKWEYAIEFEVGAMNWTVLFAPNCRRVRLAETGATATLRIDPNSNPPRGVMDGVVQFMREQFETR